MHYYVPSIPMTKPELVKAVRERGLKSVSAVFARWRGGDEDAASKPALASLLATIWADEYEDERDARFINDRVHGNIQKDGTFSVDAGDARRRLHAGGAAAHRRRGRQIQRAAGEADRRPADRSASASPKEDLPAVWRDSACPPAGPGARATAPARAASASTICRFGLGDSMGARAARSSSGSAASTAPAKMKLATAGCPRNCSEAMVKDVGAVAIGGGKWEIYIGGAAGAHVRKGDLLCTVDSEDEVLRSPAVSCSTTARTRSTRSAPTPSSSASAWSGSARWWWTTARASRRSSMRRWRNRARRSRSMEGSGRPEDGKPVCIPSFPVED